MFKRLLAPAAVVACAGLAIAQPATGNHQPDKKDTTPGKTVQPSKPETKKDAPATAATLKVGSAAPAITVDKWIKGDAVTGFEKGKVYVVEFWATWCPPCRESIPHLTKLQKANKDVTFIGVASSERVGADGKDTRLAGLEKFVKGEGDKMAYTVAYDPDHKMGTSWLQAAGKTTIPTLFIVNGEGKIAWIGNPGEADFEPQLESTIKTNKKSATSTDTKKDATSDKQEKKDSKLDSKKDKDKK